MTRNTLSMASTDRIPQQATDRRPGQWLAAIGAIGGSLATVSCCIVPLLLFTVGVGGAWIGTLTRLAPYQPYLLSITAICLATGYGLVYRNRRAQCARDDACARRLPNRIVLSALVTATALAAAAVAFDVAAPLFLSS